jgi:formylglycine-generating enzyme required for sulfatase activity
MAAALILAADAARADTFGSGDSQFTIDFVSISAATNPTSGIPAGNGFTFSGVASNYRMGRYEISNDQWNKFTTSVGVPLSSFGSGSYFTGTNGPTDNVSWFDAAQFVNWLNTSTGHQPAYKFTGTQGTGDYRFAVWTATDSGYDANNPYRNKYAYYFLPTENEWVKAAYWNGSALQEYATKPGESLTQGDGRSGSGWNYFTTHCATTPAGPWSVGSGSQELNGTYDMMGNDYEWVESPLITADYGAFSKRYARGGSWPDTSDLLASSYRMGAAANIWPYGEANNVGFRVASVPEPSTLVMLLAVDLTALFYRRRKRA